MSFYSDKDRYSLRHADEFSLKTNYRRTNVFLNLVFNRIVHMWNTLPLDIRSSPTVSVFKSRVETFLVHQC